VHMFNHSLSKSLAFFSVGRLGQVTGSHEIARLSGALRYSRVWGVGLLCSFLALTGAAPFGTFLSEFGILRSAFDGGHRVLFVAALAALGLAFLGLMRHAIRLAWAQSDAPPCRIPWRLAEGLIVGVTLILLLTLGVGWPEPVRVAAEDAARIVNGPPPPVIAQVAP
jgi:formate hydrogenlyase subunit 3/multisubunit Na+/H+ antiporter MnhD subunit